MLDGNDYVIENSQSPTMIGVKLGRQIVKRIQKSTERAVVSKANAFKFQVSKRAKPRESPTNGEKWRAVRVER